MTPRATMIAPGRALDNPSREAQSPICYHTRYVNRRPQLRIVAPAAASAEEAAAVVAALEQFMRDSAPLPAPAPSAPQRSAWARASLLEATGHRDDVTWGR